MLNENELYLSIHNLVFDIIVRVDHLAHRPVR